MAVTAKWFGKGPLHLCNGDVIWKATGGSTIKAMLCDANYTPDQDAHEFKSSVTNEVTGTGYTAGGAALTLADPAYDAASNETRLDANDISWANSTITARYAVIYKDTGNAATSPLLAWVDFGQLESSSSGSFTIQWATTGILKITAA